MGKTLILCVLASLAVPVAPALSADCTTPAAPKVDWQRCYMDERDLSGHDLSGARLRETSFQRSLLHATLLQGVDAYRVRFVSADLRGAVLDQGTFAEADFTKADLTGASLKQADLRRAKFFRASLRGTDLTGAQVDRAEFLNADLSGARWTDGGHICAEGSVGQCK